MAVGVRPDDPMTELVCQDLRQYTILDGLLYCHDPKSKCGHPLKHLKLYVPTAIRGCLLKYYHDHPTAGYLNVAKTVARVKLRFFWLNLASNARTYVASCVVCQDSKKGKESQWVSWSLFTCKGPGSTLVCTMLVHCPALKVGMLMLGMYCFRQARCSFIPHIGQRDTLC